MPGLVDELGDWQIYCFDNAIGYFVTVVKNALAETNKIGIAPNIEDVAKYTLERLLDNDFRMPRPLTAKAGAPGARQRSGLNEMLAAFPGAVTRWRQAPLEQDMKAQ